MSTMIEKIRGIRTHLLNQVAALNERQLNKIPDRFNNNIIWNLGHLICVQQNMCYVRSGLPPIVDEAMIRRYMPGTKPEKPIEQKEIDEIVMLMTETINKTEADLNVGLFKTYTPSLVIPKVYGFDVSHFDEALVYLLYHEGLHSGNIQAIKKLVE